MARGRRMADDLVLEMAEMLLQEMKEPMHYKVMAVAMGGSETIPGKEPDQVLYSRMHNDVKRKGNDSAFRFLGNGVFCASTVDGADLIAIGPEGIRNNAKPYDPQATADRRRPDETIESYERRLGRMHDTHTCGNCRFLQFIGPYALSRSRGYCGNYETSRLCGVDAKTPGCPGWQLRGIAQFRRDDTEIKAVTIALEESVKKGKKNATRR